MKVFVGVFSLICLVWIYFFLYPPNFLYVSSSENISIQGVERKVDDVILGLSRIVDALVGEDWIGTDFSHNDNLFEKAILIVIVLFFVTFLSGVIFYLFRLRKDILSIKLNNDTLLSNINKNVFQPLPDDIDSLLKSAEQGSAQAQHSIGVCYYDGNGVPKDQRKAAGWFKKAAEQGLSKAQYNLGVCYYKGEGVPKDKSEAVTWFRKTAEQGLAEAQYILGFCYDNGEGIAKNQSESIKWYEKAADQGDTSALRAMVLFNIEGTGTKKNSLLGYRYLLLYKVAGGDDENLLNKETHLEKILPAEQRAKAQTQARLIWEKIQNSQ